MGTLKHPENLLTVRWRRQSSQSLAATVDELSRLAVDNDASDSQARRLLAEIEHQLTLAHEAYHHGRNAEAIAGYRLAQGLVYQRIDPRVPARAAQRAGQTLPLDPQLFRALLSAGLELVEALEPATPERGFAAVDDLPAAVLAATAGLRQQGVHLADERIQEARQATELAAAYAERGQWTRALQFIERAKQGALPQDASAARQVRAALALTEAALRIQFGDTRGAAPLLADAMQLYTEGVDVVGQAQVEFNRAALFQKEGRRADADQALTRAILLLDRAAGRADTGPVPPKMARLAPKASLSARLTHGSVSVGALDELRTARGAAVTYRLPGAGGGWFAQPLQTPAEARERQVKKSLTLMLGGKTLTVEWTAGGELPVAVLTSRYFEEHARAVELGSLIGAPRTDAELAVLLPHLHLYLIPLGLADALHAQGDYAAAEALYLSVAGYPFINTAIEVAALWQKIAANALAWGDKRYKNDDLPGALEVYRKVVEPPGSATVVPVSAPLFAHAKLGKVGARVRAFLETAQGSANGLPVAGPDDNPVLLATVMEIRARVMQLNAGLDYMGFSSHFVPIWSFEFLQGVARYFAQQAIQAERELVRFLEQADSETMTALQLEQAVDITAAEQQAAAAQSEAALAERDVYALGVVAALERSSNARADLAEFEAMSNDRIEYDRQIQHKAEDIAEDDPEAVFAFLQEQRDRRVLEYELGSRARQIEELNRAANIGQLQLEASKARLAAAQQMEMVAGLKNQAASEQLAAFESEFFTPDVWKQMAGFIRDVSKRYLAMATVVARMMERAYNFEQDLAVHVIRVDYAALGVKGLLGGDLLLGDVDSFTYDFVRRLRPKDVPLKRSLSLADNYPFPFATKFRGSGRLDFETRLLDFDLAHPGTFATRLQRVEVEVDGVLPRGGIHGMLTNSGISLFRTATGEVKFRIQPRETMPLSEYRMREDGIAFTMDGKQLALFQGAGLASTWTLDIPASTNDLNYSAITDVRLIFYYTARFDPALEALVKQELATAPGAFARARHLQLRWAYPDAYFHFLDTGRLEFALGAGDIPLNQTMPLLRHLSIRAVGGAAGIAGATLRFATPGHADTVPAPLDATGLASTAPGHPWQPLLGGTMLGSYVVELRAEENPTLVVDGRLDLSGVDDVLVFLEYDFTPR